MKKFFMSTFVLASMTMMVGFTSAATSNVMQPGLKTRHDTITKPNLKIKANSTATYQNGLMPSQIKTAYGINLLSQTGVGQTIAIIDAYGSPTAANDLATFDTQFGLPTANLTVHNMGTTQQTNGGWALETDLDLQWAHAIAPQANLLLVEAKSASTTDLLAAIDYATSVGAVVVSNSWGGSEFSGESSYDNHFEHNGVVYVASSGDSGGSLEWPAVSPYMLAVGGTTLNIGSDGSYSSETAWTSSGGGKALYEPMPSYQSVIFGSGGTFRGVPDVSMDADPNTGVAVYDSTPDNGSTGWFQVGGTSLSAPMWAGLVALTDQSRTVKLTSYTAIGDLYNMPAADFHDIVSPDPPANPGYDFATGIGTPVANKLVPDWIVSN